MMDYTPRWRAKINIAFLSCFYQIFCHIAERSNQYNSTAKSLQPPAPMLPSFSELPHAASGTLSIHACIQEIPTSTSSYCGLCPFSSLFHRPCLEVNSLQDSTHVPQGFPGISFPPSPSEDGLHPSPSIVSSSGLSGSSPFLTLQSLRQGLLLVSGWS